MIAHFKDQGFESLLNRIQVGESIDYFVDALSNEVFERSTSDVVKKSEGQGFVKKTNKFARGGLGLSLSLPIEKNRFWLSSFFGPRKNPDNSWGFHRGVDM